MKARIKKEKILVHEPSCGSKPEWPKILRILMTDEFTKVDFGYQATAYYLKGGWVKIDKSSFIRDCTTLKKYKFLRVDRIPEAPHKHKFKTTIEYLYFSLYFEPIPQNVECVDIIEMDKKDGYYSNFYRVNIRGAEKETVI